MARKNKSDAVRDWPHNGRPSSRHVWKCLRCGATFNSTVDACGPIYCVPGKEWMIAHPDDDGMLGERKTPFG